MKVLQRATEKTVCSVFIFNIAVAKLTMASELELMAAYITQMVVISLSNDGESGFLEGIPENHTQRAWLGQVQDQA